MHDESFSEAFFCETTNSCSLELKQAFTVAREQTFPDSPFSKKHQLSLAHLGNTEDTATLVIEYALNKHSSFVL